MICFFFIGHSGLLMIHKNNFQFLNVQPLIVTFNVVDNRTRYNLHIPEDFPVAVNLLPVTEH